MATDAVNPELASSNKCKVLIIGAGIAGISAAHTLYKSGIKEIRILEASNRLGGRIHTVELGSRLVELGANWIHGVLGNPIYELAFSNSLLDFGAVRKSHNVVGCTQTGKQVPISVIQEVYETYHCLIKKCSEYFILKSSPQEGVSSMGEELSKNIEKWLEQFPEKDRPIRQMIFNHLISRETCISGCDSLNEIDLFGVGSYDECPGGNITLENGYIRIVECLTQHFPKECISYCHTVCKIRWTSNDKDFPIEVICENNVSLYCEHVIVTVSLGFLKKHAKELFEPSLPASKLQAIEKLCFGVVDKIFLLYEKPFLNPEISEVIILWDLPKEIEDISQRWYKKIYSFGLVFNTLLLAWVSGKEAIYMEGLSEEEIAETLTKVLRGCLNDPYIPKPLHVIRTKWYEDPFSKGSYSSIGVGSSQDDIICLSNPLFSTENSEKPLVLFAGEAVHPTFYSTTHGALLSGRQAAQQIIKCQ